MVKYEFSFIVLKLALFYVLHKFIVGMFGYRIEMLVMP
jgi:nitrate reductase NapE component